MQIRMAILSRKHVNIKDVLVYACTTLLHCCAIALIDEKGTWGVCVCVQMENSIEEYNTAVSSM